MQSEIFLTIFDLFLRFNRRLVSITQRLAPSLSINESHLLSEISQKPKLSSKQLSEILVLEKSTVSRTVTALLKKGYLTVKAAEQDKRQKELLIIDCGAVALKEDSALRNRQVSECIAALAAAEQSDLGYFLKIMADGFGAFPVKASQDDNLVKIEIRRLTRSMGYLGQNFLDTGISIEKCQILCLTLQHSNNIALNELLKMLPFETSVLSRMVSGLAKAGFLKKITLPGDRRRLALVLTTRGIQLTQEILTTGSNQIEKSLKNLDNSALTRFVELLQKFLPNSLVLHERDMQDRIRISRLKSSEDRQVGRGFLIENLVRLNRHYETPELLIPSSSITHGLYVNGCLKGISEIQKIKKSWTITNFITAPQPEINNFFASLLRSNLEEALKRRHTSRVLMDRSLPGASELQKFSSELTDDRLVFSAKSVSLLDNAHSSEVALQPK